MPNVQLPDNSVVNFPDDMPESQVNAAIHQHLYGNQPMEASDAFTDKAADMMSFGLAKPLNAAGDAALKKVGQAVKGMFTGQDSQSYGDLYDSSLAQANNRAAAEEEQHPIASAMGDAAGLAGSLGLGGGSAAVAPGAWNTAKALGGAARNNALISAGIGEINAVGNTHGSAAERISAAYPAGVGSAAIGAALPLAGQGIISGGSKAISPLVKLFNAPDSEVAIAKLAKRFAQDNNITPEQAQTILSNLGPDATLADAGGVNVQSLGKTVLNTPGAGANNTVSFLTGRQKGMGQRVQDIVKSGFGNNAEFNETLGNLQAAKEQAAQPFYSSAYQANQNMNSPVISKLLGTNAGKQALKYASDRMDTKMALMGVPDADLAEQAKLVGSYDGGVASGFKLQTLDYVKQGYDDQISTAIRAGEKGKAADLIEQKNGLIRELDRLDQTSRPTAKPQGSDVVPDMNGEASKILVNPTPAQAKGFLNRSEAGVARTITDEHGNTYVFDANNLTHDDVMKHYGIPDHQYDSTAGTFEKGQDLFDYIKATPTPKGTAKKGDYARARAAWSGPSQSQNALEMGRNFMNEDSQTTARDVAGLEPSDKHFFQIGAARALNDKVSSNPSNTVKNVLSNDLWKQRLKAAMPSEKHYYDFLTKAQNEATMQATKNAVMGNSSTASQLANMADEGFKMPYDLNVGNIIDASQGDIKGTALQMGRHYFNKLTAPKPGVSEQLGQMLFNPQQNQATLQAWKGYLNKAATPFTMTPQLNPFGWQAARLSYGE